ncbi:NAD(P)-dependent dehydrogenase (short-subunit alcohol dehydrogenase family) [Mucilaginibacter frigoritolerans]|uniref:NAD(P)-dependent dehydrogenase (Short-subunit alcohol dehydrogenase family) n=1 Tax=Mucilaginibacter frigoritolerans TaxID=652788 RepID=A0A562U483_9SPHI|nr:SDR family oxidoreductase [Mucilaginibacter frigoritolerans]TWJ00632.1 NAD(P)-dependent dehydrogenase (short-subunit alcohol dehydrogenase family) [Mucilaginibacter frigoritolerans]
MEIRSKIALITGANRGLGFEIARQLGKRQIKVLIGARNAAAGQAAVNGLIAEGIDALFILLDITETNSIDKAVRIVTEKFGYLDILVNNAARLPKATDSGLPSQVSQELLLEFLETNFLAQVNVTQSFLPLIKQSTAGRIVNMSSSIGSVTISSEHLHQNGPKPPRIPYAASKAALNMFTVILAKELRQDGIKVNSADPGLTQTDAGGPNAPYTVEQGARPAVWLACLDDDGPTGCFFTHVEEHVVNNPW